MKLSPSFPLGLLALPSLISAIPANSVPEPTSQPEIQAISPADFVRIRYIEQYAAAAYCPSNFQGANSLLTCTGASNNNAGTCDTLQNNKISTTLKLSNVGGTGTTGFVAVDNLNGFVVVSFRGTQTLLNIAAIFNLTLTPLDVCNGANNCLGGGGDFQSWKDVRVSVGTAIKDAFNKNSTLKTLNKVVVTGHSLGGAIATVAAVDLRNQGFNVDLATYGAPRVGNSVFAAQAIVPQVGKQGQNFRLRHGVGPGLTIAFDPVPASPDRRANFNGNYAHFLPELILRDPLFGNVTAANISPRNRDDDTASPLSLVTAGPAHNNYFNGIANCGNSVQTLVQNNGNAVKSIVANLTRQYPSPGLTILNGFVQLLVPNTGLLNIQGNDTVEAATIQALLL